ncbi:probable polyol transporter 4 [Cryptomeria japonica]|uniref:probable polyol transporter 4 n=1 Tax=Cryptomeria japonica TaxID=3369 RepID=UPI0027DA2497|nr:probable polyol transporter 4 [Cryptomeria japonica]
MMGWGNRKDGDTSNDLMLPTGKYELVNNHSVSSGGKKPMNRYVLACAILASMNSIVLGYDGGVMSGAIMFIQEDLHINEEQIEVLIGSLSIVSLLGAAAAGRTSDAIGRRWTMALTGLICMLGAGIMGLAQSFFVLMVGRFLGGIGVGFGLLIAPVYTAEVSPASSRGALTSLPEIFINVGCLLGYISNYCLSGLPAHISWRLMLGVGLVPSVFLALGVLAMPESPRWLVMQNRIEEAAYVLARTSDDQDEADARLAEIMEAAGVGGNESNNNVEKLGEQDEIIGVPNSQILQKKHHGEGVWRELLWPTPPLQRMLIIVLGIQFFQQASGIDAIVIYSPVIFKESGIQSQAGLLGATVAVGFFKTGFVLVSAFLIDRAGRRPLLLTSALGMTVSFVALASGLFLIENTSGSHQGFAFWAMLAVWSYVAFFSIGLGPICWVLSSEIFPLRFRAQAASLGVAVNRFASGIITMTFLSLSHSITIAGTFFLFAGVSLLCAGFVYIYIPETKGKTLEEIVSFFNKEESERISQGGELELGDTTMLVEKSKILKSY